MKDLQDKQIDYHMDAWIYLRMNEWMNECMNELINKRISDRMNK